MNLNREWTEWTDMVGATIAPGDFIVYGTGHGTAMVGQIDKINKVNSRGEPITRPWTDEGDLVLYQDIMAMDWRQRKNHPRYSDWVRSRITHKDVPWATLTVVPVQVLAGQAFFNVHWTKINVKNPEQALRIELP